MERKADFHNHINSRPDISEEEVEIFVETSSERLGEFGLVGVVDFYGAIKEKKFERFLKIVNKLYGVKVLGECSLYMPAKKLFVIRGEESVTKQGHLLTLGLPIGEYVPSSQDIDLRTALIAAKALGGTTVADHPFGFEGLGEHLLEDDSTVKDGLVSAIETNNRLAVYVPQFTKAFPNRRALSLYHKLREDNPAINLGGINGSDGHTPRSPGKSYSILEIEDLLKVEAKRDVQDILRSAITDSDPHRGRRSFSYIDAARHIYQLNRDSKMGLVSHIAKHLGYKTS